ncbi:phytanoyl-CoA dioxygenase family protein [Cellvibrio mixtus]|uniref:phytanoyl-CoA dioxygenase family protein n=1 Tax=Cellvibrio mixtus TaxID=39650 RepID=UPI000587B238|nr:phytanoyl-CoA dioxygenase family protein [Cellvibrio mixtus]
MLSPEQILHFKNQGFLILPQFESVGFCEAVIELAKGELQKHAAPIEYEADTQYPGAPHSRDAEGGKTARRLLSAYARDPLLAQWATAEKLRAPLQQLLGSDVFLSQCHHNCIMTKQPAYSSRTGWHRDSRYWNFARPQLISAWLALGNELEENGCLWVIPGSQELEIDSEQLDKLQFLRTDLELNKTLLEQAIPVPLKQGDLLLFHSNLFHAAGRNTTNITKFSMVFTYRDALNLPKPGTRSSVLPDIKLN